MAALMITWSDTVIGARERGLTPQALPSSVIHIAHSSSRTYTKTTGDLSPTHAEIYRPAVPHFELLPVSIISFTQCQ